MEELEVYEVVKPVHGKDNLLFTNIETGELLAPHQSRVVVEYNHLLEKVNSLKGFIESDNFLQLNFPESEMLKAQLIAMESYLNILKQRILFFCSK